MRRSISIKSDEFTSPASAVVNVHWFALVLSAPVTVSTKGPAPPSTRPSIEPPTSNTNSSVAESLPARVFTLINWSVVPPLTKTPSFAPSNSGLVSNTSKSEIVHVLVPLSKPLSVEFAPLPIKRSAPLIPCTLVAEILAETVPLTPDKSTISVPAPALAEPVNVPAPEKTNLSTPSPPVSVSISV